MKVCPIPIEHYPLVTMGHGGGGRLMHDLIEKLFYTAFGNSILRSGHDGAVLPAVAGRSAFSTDSYVVTPLFFPGGDIGKLAVYGTVNDLAMCGANPKYLALSLIIEEGLPMETLWRVVCSLAGACAECEVQIVTGDTKVVERGSGDQIFINTAGIGEVANEVDIQPRLVSPGDAVILSGDIGRHGIAVLAAREELGFSSTLESDCAPLHTAVKTLLASGANIHCLRDLTRGGLASALNEIAVKACVTITFDERLIEIPPAVRGACEMLGLDPLYVANEGRFIAIVPERDAECAVTALKSSTVAKNAKVIGHVAAGPGLVTMKSSIGTSRIIDLLSGEQLPRIC